MLPNEIVPFAEYNRNLLKEVVAQIDELSKTETPLTKEIAQELFAKINRAHEAFYRFEICMADEVKQKERLHKKNLECRINHK